MPIIPGGRPTATGNPCHPAMLYVPGPPFRMAIFPAAARRPRKKTRTQGSPLRLPQAVILQLDAPRGAAKWPGGSRFGWESSIRKEVVNGRRISKMAANHYADCLV